MEFGFRWYSKIGFCWVFHLTHLFRFDISGPQRNAESFEAVRVWPGVRSAHGRQGRADGRASAVGRVTARGDALPPVSSPLAHTHRTRELLTVPIHCPCTCDPYLLVCGCVPLPIIASCHSSTIALLVQFCDWGVASEYQEIVVRIPSISGFEIRSVLWKWYNFFNKAT